VVELEMIANGQVRLIVFQTVFDRQPAIIRDLITFLENPPMAGSFCIHAVGGKIAFAEKKETVKD
jgi:hypothetical protein